MTENHSDDSERNQNDCAAIPPVNEMVAVLIAGTCADNADCIEKVQGDPQGALEQLSGQALSESMQVRAVRNTADTVHVPLPYYTLPSQQLTAEQLERVSGGVEIVLSVATALTSFAYLAGTAVGVSTATTAIGVGAAVIGGVGLAAVATAAGIGGKIAAIVLAAKGKI